MKRALKLVAILLACVGLVIPTTAAASAAHRTGSWTALRDQFDYVRRHVEVTQKGTTVQGTVTVHDITYHAAGQDSVSAYLVTPSQAGLHPAALFLHWLDTPAVSTRAEFLDEAVALAAGPEHVVSLLPQLTFPFAYGPVGDVRDRDSVIKQVIQLRRGLDLLDARSDVDSARVAVVGHDYGAMYATVLSAVDRTRVRSTVIMAADATMSNWFVQFFLSLTPAQTPPYDKLLASVNPIRYIGHEPKRLLLQYATDDFFIPLSVAESMHAAAGPRAKYRTYDVDHSLNTPAARADRDAFLDRTLRR